ncbi:MAG: ATP-dependent helicase [Candidatus Aphodosoma sp.]
MIYRMELTDFLNPTQEEAVRYLDGPEIIIAGAGSGKTRVLTYKIAYLLEMGYKPYEIMALTFTNKAAKEMKERIAKLVDPNLTKYLWMGTFHSIFSRILRVEYQTIGFNSNYTIYDTSDSKSLIKSIVKDFGLEKDKEYKDSVILSRISYCKNHLIMPQQYSSDYNNLRYDERQKIGRFADIYTAYCHRCKEANAMDFDDILVYTYSLFTNCVELRNKYARKFKYILVDEYQDTNSVQHAIVKLLFNNENRVCVVGDDAQSIYSFRGAVVDNFIDFASQLAGCKLFKLEQNYRSTQTIVEAANSLIAKNKRQMRKHVFSKLSLGDPITVTSNYSDLEEGVYVANTIAKAVSKKIVDYQDIAILYRTNSQSRIFEHELTKNGIPYSVYGGLSFYQRKEVKDVLAYMRFSANSNDIESLKRIINYPTRGIGAVTVDKILMALQDNGSVDTLTILLNPTQYIPKLNSGTANKIITFANLIKRLSDNVLEMKAEDFLTSVIYETNIMQDLSSDTTIEGKARVENVQELQNAVAQFSKAAEEDERVVTIADFLNNAALSTDQDEEKPENKNSVKLMTIHAAKGLEFNYVFIVGLEENLFPNQFVESEADVEEERRLLYVAITRAKERCFISYAKSRFRNGQSSSAVESRFLYDIDKKFLDWQDESMPRYSINPYGFSNNGYSNNSYTKKEFSRNEQRFSNSTSNENPIVVDRHMQDLMNKLADIRNNKSTVSQNSSVKLNPSGVYKKIERPSQIEEINEALVNGVPYHVGDNIIHDKFGIGVIASITNDISGCKAVIDFDDYGKKSLLLKLARIKKLN